jgi:uncharacterized membrane protein
MKTPASQLQEPPRRSPRSPAAASVTELTRKNVEDVIRLEEEARQSLPWSHRFSDAVARFCGSIAFLWIHVAGFTLWILLNILPGGPRLDPVPFAFLSLAVSLEAIFLSTFILISQNAETRLRERRHHLDLQINLLAEQENTEMMKLLEAIAKKVGVRTDEVLKVLEQPADPEELVSQIKHAEDAGKIKS